MTVQFQILGSVQVTVGGEPIPLGPPQQVAVLAALVLHPNQVLATDRIVDIVWGEDPPRTAAHIVHTYVSQLRGLLPPNGPMIATEAPGYALRVSPDDVDAARFERLLHRARELLSADPAEAERLLEAGLKLWRGPPLADFAYSSFAESEVRRLSELRVVALEEKAAASLALGRHQALVAQLEGLLAEHPYRERLWAQLMLALYRCGRQADALQAFQRVQTMLGDELGIDPSPELRALEERILLQDKDLLLPVSERVAGNLPSPVSSFVGRVDDLAALGELVADHRLVTLVGPAGVGKTRLALEAAHDAAAGFTQGAWLVELAPIEQDELIAPAVAGALGVQEFRSGMDLEERLLDHLEAKEALLVVDNCEHLVAETAHLVAAMLSRCRRLRVLATSREPLRVEGEVTVPVLPLAAPSGGDTGPVGGYDAVRLFCERVTAVVPGFELDDGNRAAVGQICARLDGIPLALELAAARTRSFTPDEIAARLTDRFQFLTSGARDSLPHHRTLEAALTWSYELLEAKERLLFDRLSVFAGGFSLAAAEAVCASDDLPGTEVVDVVAALVAKSLVIAEQTSPAESRYRLLESLRAFGRERLAIGEDLDQIARRHAFHFAEVAERSMSQSYGEEQTAMLRHMASEQDNIRAALSWTLEHDEVGLVTRIAAATWWFWYLSGSYTEAFNWLQRTVDLEGDIPAEVRVNALNGLGSLAQCLDEMEIAASRLAEAIEIARRDLGPSRWLGSALHNMAEIQTAVGDHEQARQLYEESLAVDYEIHHPGVALTLCMRGYNAICRGKLAEAEELLQESLAATGEVAAMEVVTARAFLALAKVLQGHSVAATEDISRAIAIGRRLDLTPVLVDVLLVEALVARSRGKCSEALAHLGESLRLARQAGSAMMGRLEHLAWWLRTAATIHAELELWRPAATLAGAAAAVQELSPTAAAPWSRRDLDRQMEEVRTRLGGEEFEESWKAGLAMTSDDAVRLALGPTVLSTTGV